VNVSPRAALAVIALALVVSVVAGREARPPAPAPALPAAAPAARDAPTEAGLELHKLGRPRLGELQANLFAPRRPRAAARPAPSGHPASAAPAVPAPPYRYLGQFADGARTAVYIARGEEHFLATPGATLPGEYRVEEVSAGAITLLYLPLGTRQSVPIPPRP
jgi:hypothetical protein